MEGVQKRDVRQEVVNSIIEKLEQGVMPWRKGWGHDVTDGALLPRNGATGHVYRGGNRLHLMMAMMDHGYSDPRFMTFKQLQAWDAYPAKGSRGYAVEYWDRMPFWRRRDIEILRGDTAVRVAGVSGQEVVLADGQQVHASELGVRTAQGRTLSWSAAEKTLDVMIARHSVVFNVAQCRNIEAYLENNPLEIKPKTELQLDKELAAISQAMKSTGLQIEYLPQDRAFYEPASDRIVMPMMQQFHSMREFRSTLLHEMVHATGHEKRLAREGITEFARFGDERYAKEELVAELGSAFIAAETGLERDDRQHAAYIDLWLKALRGKDGKHVLYEAAREADRASDYLLQPLRERERSQEISRPQEVALER